MLQACCCRGDLCGCPSEPSRCPCLAGCSHCVRRERTRGHTGPPQLSPPGLQGAGVSSSLAPLGQAAPSPSFWKSHLGPPSSMSLGGNLDGPLNAPLRKHCSHSFSAPVARSPGRGSGRLWFVPGGRGPPGAPPPPPRQAVAPPVPQFPLLRNACQPDQGRGCQEGRDPGCGAGARAREGSGIHDHRERKKPARNDGPGSWLLEAGVGRGPQGTLFTTFCFSVVSTFAKMGLLTFGGGSMGCVWPRAGRVGAACGQPQRAGGWAPPGRRLGSGSEHRARPGARARTQAAIPVEENGLSGEAPPFIAAPLGQPRAQGGTRRPPGRAVPMLPLRSPHKGPVLCLIFLVPRGSPNALGRCMTVHFTGEGKEAQRG